MKNKKGNFKRFRLVDSSIRADAVFMDKIPSRKGLLYLSLNTNYNKSELEQLVNLLNKNIENFFIYEDEIVENETKTQLGN